MTTTTHHPTLDHRDLPHLLSRMTGDEKHDPASQSTLDVVWVLYHDVLSLTPDRVDDPDRDRFYLSKGHGPMAFYATLAAHGFFPAEWLDGAMAFDSPLGAHPDRTLIPGCEISAGSLGHGLPLAVGTALGLRARGSDARVYVLVGDAELDEGSNDEAIAFAGAIGLDNLTVVAVDNSSSTHNRPHRLARRFDVEQWSTTEIDGHDHDAIRSALTRSAGRPAFIAALVERKS
ncbi:transketolase [Williamsia maris]|uniref:Transketolase n=1 Tax=Williamsia maris TaxID=72806 RepID=A0ABT1HHS7_9NOCA|nr:transketolase [Williamsia maris]MCP2177318.1 transketolase [Williamsia maris]